MVQYIGAHILGNISIFDKIKECIKIGGNAIQIFTKSPMNTTEKINLTKEDIIQILKITKEHNILLVTHGSYMLNMSWPIHRNPWGMKMLADDLQYTSEMGGLGVVIHMGQATPKLKITMDQARDNFVKSIGIVLDKSPPDVKIILETSCNQTNTIAGTIEDLAILWKMFPKKYLSRLGFCIDTAHIFAAGYEIHKPKIFTRYMHKFDTLIGIKYINLFHINDSAAQHGSHIDKHTGLGKGYIYKKNTDAFIDVVNICIQHSIPMILETHDNYKKEILFIKKIIKKRSKDQSKGTSKDKIITNQPIITRSSSNPQIKNKVITILTELADIEKSNGNIYKRIAYLRAVKNITEFTGDLTKVNLLQIEGVGPKISTKIREIMETGKLSQFEVIKDDPKLNAINELIQIMGIGSIYATKLVNTHKIMSILSLKKEYESNNIELTNEQILGIKYYKHLQYRIPRSEAVQFKTIIDCELNKLNKDLKSTIAGSFRRGKDELGDIDVIIYNKKMDDVPPVLLQTIRDQLNKIIVADIAMGVTKYNGLISLKKQNSKVRRLDIRIVPYTSFATTLLYFTGSKEFNQKMRSNAKKKGFLLNEYGLYKLTKNDKIKIYTSNEKDIFDKLNMKYIHPINRI